MDKRALEKAPQKPNALLHFLRFLKKKMFGGKISIRLSFILFFISLITFVSVSIFAVGQYTLNRVLISSTKNLIEQSDYHIRDKLEAYLRPLNHDVMESASEIEHGLVQPGSSLMFMQYMNELLNNHPQAFAAVWVDPGDTFYAILRIDDSGNLHFVYNIHENKQLNYYDVILDKDGKVLERKKVTDIDFVPTQRPWYLAAVKDKKPVWTGIYQFFNILRGDLPPLLGFTAAKPVYDEKGKLRGVMSLSVTSKGLSEFIASIRITPNNIIFITDQDNKLIAASSNLKAEKYIGVQVSPEIWQKLKTPIPPERGFIYLNKYTNQIVTYRYKGNDFFVMRQSLPNVTNTNWYITIIVPVKDIIAPLEKVTIITIFITLGILFFGIIIARYLSHRISKPIVQLVEEASAIQHLDLERSIDVKSKIKEIDFMTNAFASMQSGLKSFKSYVPTALVKKLLLSGKTAHIGGEKRTLSLLFGDIKDFTSLSENLTVEKLIDILCLFFEEMTRIVFVTHGTIDKYIGDAVMAFWNAPLPDKKHAFHVCECALMMQEKLAELNLSWQKDGFSGLGMRIGINTGEVIVGNIGSSERLNYTAIGDNVNVASRLVGINKLYDTNIIISENTYQLVKNNFLCRFLDKVAVKGKMNGINIYELVGHLPHPNQERVEAYNQDFLQAFRLYEDCKWDAAIEAFNQLIQKYPVDNLALVYIQRCEKLKYKDLRSWDGIWRVNQ